MVDDGEEISQEKVVCMFASFNEVHKDIRILEKQHNDQIPSFILKPSKCKLYVYDGIYSISHTRT